MPDPQLKQLTYQPEWSLTPNTIYESLKTINASWSKIGQTNKLKRSLKRGT